MGTETNKTMQPIQVPPIDIEKVANHIRDQRQAVQAELRRIEEAKVVSQETMRLEVSH